MSDLEIIVLSIYAILIMVAVLEWENMRAPGDEKKDNHH
jgi:hypothetical protein